MKLLHLISELNERGVSDKMFLELKRHDARIKRLTKRIKTPAGPVSQMYIESQRNGFRKPIPRAGHRVRKDFHQQKGNKIVRGEDRRSHLYDHSHRGCPDSPDDPAGAQKAAPFSISNGVMIESRHRSRASTNRYLRRGDNNPIEFVWNYFTSLKAAKMCRLPWGVQLSFLLQFKSARIDIKMHRRHTRNVQCNVHPNTTLHRNGECALQNVKCLCCVL